MALTEELKADPVVEAHERSRGNSQFGLVSLDNVERSHTMAALVFHECAVGAVGACGFRIDKMLFMRPGALQG